MQSTSYEPIGDSFLQHFLEVLNKEASDPKKTSRMRLNVFCQVSSDNDFLFDLNGGECRAWEFF